MRTRRLAILIAIFLVLAITLAWLTKDFFLRNHVTYLLNQQQFPAALHLLKELQSEDPDNVENAFLQTKTYVLTGRYDEALNFKLTTEAAEDVPEIYYWQSIAQYQTGKGKAARDSAQRFVRSGRTLPNGAGRIARALAGQSVLLEPVDKDSYPFKMLFPIERAIYAGLSGTQQLDIGRLDAASSLFRDAFMLGNRNPQLLFRAAKVCALTGDIYSATMFYDYSHTGSIYPLFQELYQQYKTGNNVTLTLQGEDLALGTRKIDVARAVAWSALEYLDEDPTGHEPQVVSVFKALRAEYSYDPVLQVREAAMLEKLGRYPEAYNHYKGLQKKYPSYIALIRMSVIEGLSEVEISKRASQFIMGLNPVASLDQSSLLLENGNRKPEFTAFYSKGSATGKINIAESGRYTLTAVAKGDRATGMWPLVSVHIDGEFLGYLYICRETWDCFTITIPLTSGDHEIELSYDNDAVSSNSENRSFYLRGIYVTGTGFTNVR